MFGLHNDLVQMAFALMMIYTVIRVLGDKGVVQWYERCLGM